MFVISSRAKRELKYYKLDADDVESTVRRPDRRFDRDAGRVLAQRVFEGEYYWLGKFCKKCRIEVLYQEAGRDTTVVRVKAEYS